MSVLSLPIILLRFFATVSFVSSSGCYYADNATILASPEYVDPCGDITSATSFLNCCALQSNNICLSNSICYDPNQLGGVYYLSPCTDKTYSAPECPQYCSNRADKNQLDVTYDSTNQIWRCCSTNEDGTANCSHPTDETFSAPPPSSLSTLFPATSTPSSILPSSLSSLSSPSLSSSSSFSVASSSTSSSSLPPSFTTASTASSTEEGVSSTSDTNPVPTTPVPTTPSPPNDNDNGGLAIGDKVALGVGVPATLAAIAGTFFAYATWRRKSRKGRPK